MKRKIKNFLIIFIIPILIAYTVFMHQTFNLLSSDSDISIYGKTIVINNFDNYALNYLAIYKAERLGDSKTYFYGECKLPAIEFNDSKDVKYISYDDSYQDSKYLYEGENRDVYFIYDKYNQIFNSYKYKEEYEKALEKRKLKDESMNIWKFKLFKTKRKFRILRALNNDIIIRTDMVYRHISEKSTIGDLVTSTMYAIYSFFMYIIDLINKTI